MGGRTFGSVLLTGPSGNTWKVDLMKKKDSLFFNEGWPTFVREHLINLGEFLLFRYDGNLKFTVTIYDRSACKKEASLYAKCSQPADDIAKEGKKRARAKADISWFQSIVDSPKRLKGCSETVDHHAANSFSTKLPFFVIRIQKYNLRTGILHVPKKFLKEHCLSYQSKEKMVLRNHKGESHSVNIISRPSQCSFSAGWSSFVSNSEIKEKDTCMSEMVNKFEMHVHIIRREI